MVILQDVSEIIRLFIFFFSRIVTAGLKVVVVGIYKDFIFKMVPQVIMHSPGLRAGLC